MKRSAAPSQLALKKLKFTPPSVVNKKSTSPLSENEKITLLGRETILAERSLKFKAACTFPSPEKIIKSTCDRSDFNGIVKKLHAGTFKIPLLSGAHKQNSTFIKDDRNKICKPSTPQPAIKEMRQANGAEVTSKYFSVMWCKLSKKKHKKWEGDAILIAKGHSVVLQDLEGREIGKSSGYKSSELLGLKGGETLVIGGKEIEIMGEIPQETFHSGKCYQNSSSSSANSLTVKDQGVSKAFVKPSKPGQTLQNTQALVTAVIKPRHDPTAPNALVMTHPSQSHQRNHNKLQLPVIEVVIDPHLCIHLRPHQREGVKFLYECAMGMRDYSGRGAILADDMGLGKTLQCISLIWTLLKQGPYGRKPVIKRVLIITPGSLVKNWKREFRKWLGSERISVFAVSQDNRVEDFLKTSIYPVLIISYEMFVRSYDLIKDLQFGLVACDEGHRLKNTSIKTTSLISSLATRRRIVLTGTPVQNDLQEFFSIVEFCNPSILGTSSAFHRIYEAPVVAARQPGATAEEVCLGNERSAELSRLTSMFILRRTSDINNKYLPPKIESVVFCKPAPIQLQLYRQLVGSSTFRSCFTRMTDCGAHLVCISSLKKLCNHPKLVYNLQNTSNMDSDNEQICRRMNETLRVNFPDNFDPNEVGLEHCGKLQALDALLSSIHNQDPTDRVVLVSNYTKTLDILQNLCEMRKFTFLRLDGQTPTSKRQQLVEHFNSQYSKTFIFLLSSKAGGVGLNLIGASRLVLYDIDWNPANDLQAMARVWRDGQKKKVYIYRLLTTGSIEESIYQRQISKQGLSGAIFNTGSSTSNVHFSKDDLKDLFTLHESTTCYTHELLDCSCNESRTTADQKTQDISRLGQLTAGSVKRKKNLAMDELMSWQHVLVSDDVNSFKDVHLQSAKDHISYIFWHESNKQVANVL